MHILVTGGTGFIGRALIADLLDAGHRVTVLTRNVAAAQRADPRAGVSEWLNESDWEPVGYPLPHPTKITPSFGEKQGEGIAIKFSVPRAAPAPPRPAIALSHPTFASRWIYGFGPFFH